MCFAAMCFATLLLVMRSVLIIMGLFKDPVLHSFERYGDSELYYNALPPLLFWVGLAGMSAGIWLDQTVVTVFMPLQGIGVVLIMLAYLVQRYPWVTRAFFHYPRWYFDLLERTSRSERRRIAYMWLRISWRAQLRYNSSDKAFLQWADMIILSTIYL